eukprot:scaffold114_cov200-Alexandrium_tamarense.AAC.35
MQAGLIDASRHFSVLCTRSAQVGYVMCGVRAHLLCLVEWRHLIPPLDNVHNDDDDGASENESSSTNSKQVKSNVASKKNALQKIFSKITDGDSLQSTALSRCLFYVFSTFSFLITIVPTSLLPMALMFSGISMRLIPHLPQFQHLSLQSSTLLTLQHYQFGLLYLSLGFHYLLQICSAGGPIHIGNLLFIVWMSDTGALIFGRMSKEKQSTSVDASTCSNDDDNQLGAFLSFLKSISPGKTLPGLVGALITGPLSALAYPIYLSSGESSTCSTSDEVCIDDSSTSTAINQLMHNPIVQKMILGLLLSLSGITGDLAESSVKRISKKKNSGGLLPGHGGVVDRFDSLFTGGVVYFYFVLA